MEQIKHFPTCKIFIKIFQRKNILFDNIKLSNVQKLSISCSDRITDRFECFHKTKNYITSVGNFKIMPLTTLNKFQVML